MRTALLLAAAASSCLTGGRAAAGGQDGLPTINPMAVYTTENGEEESDDFSGDAPLAARFEARADGTAGYEAAYEWRFTLEGEAEPYLVRHEENTGYTFTRAGTHLIELYATFVNRGDTIAYTAAYRGGGEWLEELKGAIMENYAYLLDAFRREAPGVVVSPLEGTYLCCLDLGAYIKGEDMKEFLQKKCRLALDYGEWFGGERFATLARMNLATSLDNVRIGVESILRELKKLP